MIKVGLGEGRTDDKRAFSVALNAGGVSVEPILELGRVYDGAFVHWRTEPESKQHVKWVVNGCQDFSTDTSEETSGQSVASSEAEKKLYKTRFEEIRGTVADSLHPKYKLLSVEGTKQGELIRLIFAFVNVYYDDEKITQEEWENCKNKEGMTPYGSLPILSKGKVKYGEQSAIVRTLAHKYLLLGVTNREHLVVEATFERLRRLQAEHAKAINWVIAGEKNKERMDWAQSQLTHIVLPRAFSEWEKTILSSHGPFLTASGITVADLAIVDFVDQCSNNLFTNPLLDEFPAVSDLIMVVQSHPMINKYLTERQTAE